MAYAPRRHATTRTRTRRIRVHVTRRERDFPRVTNGQELRVTIRIAVIDMCVFNLAWQNPHISGPYNHNTRFERNGSVQRIDAGGASREQTRITLGLLHARALYPLTGVNKKRRRREDGR